jgi:SAM-dependent methyltransferase
LDAHGPEDVKRRQALRYFTWQWRLRAIRHSEQFRFLLRHTSPWTWLRCALSPADLRSAAWKPLVWSVVDRWLYTFAVRLLWEYARTKDSLGVLALPEPVLGNPPPVRLRGRLISQDLANAAVEVDAIRRLLDGRHPRTILEIGAGYGRSAYVLLSIYPDSVITIVDIDPAIEISRWYLTQLFPPERLRFVRPEELGEVAAGSIDLALSISSFQEMTPSQVAEYLRVLDTKAAGGRVFLKQWEAWRNPDDDVVMRFQDYPIPGRWKRLVDEPSPVQATFHEAGWVVPD